MNKLLTIKEIAEMLKISRSKAYSLSNDKSFPIVKIGKCKRVFEEDLFSWLKKCKNVL